MPYVQRDKAGRIVGTFANPQPQPDGSSLTEPDPLPDDHPEVVEFTQKMEAILGPPPGPMTEEEMRRSEADFDRLRTEHEALRGAVSSFNNGFAELEIALSALLYTALNILKSQVAYAIYFSPPGFEARRQIVDNAIQQIISENDAQLGALLRPWKGVNKLVDNARGLRNHLAHGVPQTLAIGGKNYARLASPAFDVIRLGRKISQGQVPGIGATEILAGIANLRVARDRVDDVNRIMSAFHANDVSEANERIQRLWARMGVPTNV